MSRIRSTHPGIWTDERFVGVSAFARLLFMGIWNECDDYGSFEWSPLKLKMRLLPADNVDANDLMAELEATGSIVRYEIDGKAYGAVRNFCQYQRPKKPTHSFPQTEEVEAWVNTEARSTRDGSEGEGKQLPTGREKSRQMKDEGGDKEGSSNELPKARGRARSSLELPDWIPMDAWKAFVAMRRAIPKVPFTDDAAKGVIRELEKHREAGHCPEKMLLKAVTRGWRTVFPDEDTKGYGTGGARAWSAAERAAYLAKLEGGTDPPRIAANG